MAWRFALVDFHAASHGPVDPQVLRVAPRLRRDVVQSLARVEHDLDLIIRRARLEAALLEAAVEPCG